MMYDDIGIINIGQVCPYTQSDAIEEDNQFHVSLFYDLPPDQTIPGGTYPKEHFQYQNTCLPLKKSIHVFESQ